MRLYKLGKMFLVMKMNRKYAQTNRDMVDKVSIVLGK
jgi:hypothetical protein